MKLNDAAQILGLSGEVSLTAPALLRAERCTGAQRCTGKTPGD